MGDTRVEGQRFLRIFGSSKRSSGVGVRGSSLYGTISTTGVIHSKLRYSPSGRGDDDGLCDDCNLRLRDPLNLGLGLHHLRFDGSASNSGRDWLGLGLPGKHQLGSILKNSLSNSQP